MPKGLFFELIQYNSVFSDHDSKMVILLVSDQQLLMRMDHFWCNTYNKTSRLNTTAKLKLPTEPLTFCKWVLYIAVCGVTQGPERFFVTAEQSSSINALVRYMTVKSSIVIALYYYCRSSYSIL